MKLKPTPSSPRANSKGRKEKVRRRKEAQSSVPRRRSGTSRAAAPSQFLELSARGNALLAESGLDDARVIEKLGLRDANPDQAEAIFGVARAGLLFPYFGVDGRMDPKFVRLRLFEPDGGMKYLQPKGTDNHLYLPPLLQAPWADVAKDVKREIWIVEGEKKAARACLAGVNCVGIGGVDSFVMKEKVFGADGKERKTKTSRLVSEFAVFDWKARTVIIAYDSDVTTNPHVAGARVRLTAALVALGARPLVVDIPPGPDGEKRGLDDHLEAVGDDASTVAELRTAARPADDEFRRLPELNDRYCYVEAADDVYDLELSQFVTLHDFVYGRLANERVPRFTERGVREEYLGKAWLEWKLRRCVKRLTYLPGQPETTTDGSLNLWRDARPPAKKGDVSAFYEFLNHHGIVGEARRQFVQWCAYPVRHPGAKLLWAVLISGVPGCGKSLLGELIASCYGPQLSPNVSRLGSNAELHSGFNKLLLNKQFVICNEVMSSERRKEADYLKDLITRSTINAREMYHDYYPLPNCANFFFTSNHSNAIFLERGERRYLVLKSKGGKLEEQKPKLLKRLLQWLRGSAGADLRYHFENEVDLSKFDLGASPVETEAARELFEHTMTEVEHALQRIADDPDALRIGPINDGPSRPIFTFDEALSAVQRLVPERTMVSSAQLRTSNNRVPAFVKLGKSRVGKDAHRKSRSLILWCHVNDADRLRRLSHPQRIKLYQTRGGKKPTMF